MACILKVGAAGFLLSEIQTHVQIQITHFSVGPCVGSRGNARRSPVTIEINSLSHRYGNHWVLIDVTFQTKAGEVIALLGPNGSGKSTLLRILSTLTPPTLGSGTLFGYDLTKDRKKIRAQLHWLGHDFNLYKNLTAAENLKLFYQFKGETFSSQKISEVLEKVGLAGKESAFVESFSAGMRKRLALARILLKDYPLILLDEPHTNLDQEGKKLIDHYIGAWKREGKTVFLASHDHDSVLPLSDKTITLHAGRTV